ncbi:MAG: phenylalanine--tRNA ligase subunit beta, partial [Romboutsia sp.]|nr:phenylalanine--tRNA ligase subunit beta [Romboutsia sp.]
KYKELNKYPQITKDVSFVINNDITSFEVEKEIKRSGGKLLTGVVPFDVYEDKSLKDSKSITYKLTFEDTTKTLTSEEVNELFMKIIDEVSKKLNIHIRD